MSRLPVEGETFGRYRLLRRLGHGGMGVVYAALDDVLNREVALKLVAPHLADDAEFRARFAREAEVLARLDSGRAVRIFDHGEHDGVLFISTQLIEGGDLNTLMREAGALSPALAVEVVSQVLEGLGDAHAVGVVHRDVKPANVLVRQRSGEIEAFLCDFGIATTAGAQLTRTGNVAGSLPYMAPERHSGEDPGSAGDIYSAGCLLWFVLTGQAPYVGTEAEVLMGHVQGRLPQLPGRDDFSKRANAVLAKAMAKDRRKRYAGAAAMRADLQALAPLAVGSLQLPGATAVRHTVTPVRGSRWRSSVLAVVAVAAVVGASLAVRAVAGDGPETSGDTEVEVTTTIRGPHGRNIAEQRTLLPVDVVGGDTTIQAGPGEGLDDPPVQLPGGDQVGPTSAVTDDAPGPAPTVTRHATVTTRAAYNYMCWDRKTFVYELSACGTPHGTAGMQWVFMGSSCPVNSAGWQDSQADAETYTCTIVLDGTKNYLVFTRWRSIAEGKAYFNSWYDVGAKNVGTWDYGPMQSGPKTLGGGVVRSRFSREYDAHAWTMSVSATNADRRANLMGRVHGYRPPSEYAGISCSKTPEC